MWLAPDAIPIHGGVDRIGTAPIVGAANTLNCYLERESDKLMTRTKNRPLPAGRMDSSIAPHGRIVTHGDVHPCVVPLRA